MKHKLLYRFNDEKRNSQDVAQHLIKKIIVKATPSSSCWWSKMKTRTDGFRNSFEAIKQKQINYFKTGEDFDPDRGATVKTCPGIMELLKTVYLVKSPVDINITINRKGEHYFNTSDSSIVTVDFHNQDQFYQEDNQFFKDKIVIKLNIGVSIQTTGFSYFLSQPTYHSALDLQITPGLVSGKFTKVQSLNIITLIDVPKEEETKTITINEGDVLAYLTPFEKCSLSFSEENFTAKRFLSRFNLRNGYEHI